MKTDQAWRQKYPEITLKPFRTKAEYRNDFNKHIISDGKHLFVAEGFNIFVIDAETLDVLHKLDVTHDEHSTEVKPMLIRLEADGSFLVAFVDYYSR